VSCSNGESEIFPLEVTVQGEINYPPEFLAEVCGKYTWNMNNEMVLDMDGCFFDREGESLVYSYEKEEGYGF
jgi:hypothetical protein